MGMVKNACSAGRGLSVALASMVLVTVVAMTVPAGAAPGEHSISGVLKDWDTDAPVEGVVVRVVSAEATSPATSASVFTTVTAADGSFVVTGWPEPGWFHVSYIDPDDTYRDQHWFGQGVPIEGAVSGWVESHVDLGDEYVQTIDNVEADRIERLSGTDRFQTALEMSSMFATASTVVLANGLDFPDALAAAPLAGCYEAPILLTWPDRLPDGLLDRLVSLETSDVIIVGGPGVVSSAVFEELTGAGLDVERVWGANRYATAEAIVRRVGALQGSELPTQPIVVRGDDFADALAIAPFAWLEKRPILLIEPDQAPPDTIDAFRYLYQGWGTYVLVVVGGESAVGYDALGDLWEHVVAPDDLFEIRIAGANRYDTAARCVTDYWGRPLDIYALASGVSFPDALAAGPALGRYWGGVLLTSPDALASEARRQLRADRSYLWDVIIAGGPGAVSPSVVTETSATIAAPLYDMNAYSGVAGAVVSSSAVLPSLRTLERASPPPALPAVWPALTTADERPSRAAPRVEERLLPFRYNRDS